MKNIQIIDKCYSEVTDAADPNDSWSADSTHTDHNIVGFKFAKENFLTEIKVPFEILPNKDYYLVYALYTTGDSFSNHSGNMEYIDLYDNEDLANEVVKTIELDYKIYGKRKDSSFDNYSVVIKNNMGNEFKMSCPWKGYFERLDSIEAKSIRLCQ